MQDTSSEELYALLAQDEVHAVRSIVAANANLPKHLFLALAQDPWWGVRREVALNAQGRELFGDDWDSDVTLIEEDNFEEHAKMLHSDMYGGSDDYSSEDIDWEEATEELKEEYHVMEFQGVTYYAAAR